MAETDFEKFVKKLKRTFCDWGLATPKKPKHGVFYDNSAPVWKCPSPIFLLISGCLHLLIFIIMLAVAAYALDFSDKCSLVTASVRNLLIFLFLFNGGFQFYMSRNDLGTDRQWCRYITTSFFSESIQVLLAVILGSAAASCQGTDQLSYDLAVSCVFLGFILSGIGLSIIIYITVKLYFRGNPLAYNQEPDTK